MVSDVAAVAPQTLEVPMVEAEAVRQMRDLASKGWGAKRIARELGLARNTVRRYLRGGASAEVQRHPSQQRLSDAQRAEAVALFEREAEGNAVVVAQLLAERGVEASVRTVQRVVADRRRALLAAEVATVRFSSSSTFGRTSAGRTGAGTCPPTSRCRTPRTARTPRAPPTTTTTRGRAG